MSEMCTILSDNSGALPVPDNRLHISDNVPNLPQFTAKNPAATEGKRGLKIVCDLSCNASGLCYVEGMKQTHRAHAKCQNLSTPCSAHHITFGGHCLNCDWKPAPVKLRVPPYLRYVVEKSDIAEAKKVWSKYDPSDSDNQP